MNDTIKAKLELLPHSPGVYKMLNINGECIYVGKARSLKNRVRSYFQATKIPKVAALAANIHDFEIILTSSETEALTLESNLIKAFKPRYNVLLKDDKHFPYVRVDMKSDFPAFKIVRRVKHDGAHYIGPFLSGYALSDALNLVREYFPVRNCKKDISRAIARRERPCLMSHLGKCCAPCSGQISREQYHEVIHRVIEFLDGDIDDVISDLTELMQEASDALDFERAAKIRDSIKNVELIAKKQAVILTKDVNSDTFACCEYNGSSLVYAFFIRAGKVIGTESFTFSYDQGASTAELMCEFLKQYYSDNALIPNEILLAEPIPEMDIIADWLSLNRKKKVKLAIPQRGERRRIVELAKNNGIELLKRKQAIKEKEWERTGGALVALSDFLGLDEIPTRMECYDTSHFMGRDTVSSMVVFIDGKPEKSLYRRFKLKSATGGNDLLSLTELLTRRFKRMTDNSEGFSDPPDLMVIDGGKTQLNTALQILMEYSLTHIPIVALAELSGMLYLPGEDDPRSLPPHSPELHLITRLRDEAHRFAVSYHRGLSQRKSLESILDDIKGVGEKRKRILQDAFPDINALSNASVDELCKVKGIDRATAAAIVEHFSNVSRET